MTFIHLSIETLEMKNSGTIQYIRNKQTREMDADFR